MSAPKIQDKQIHSSLASFLSLIEENVLCPLRNSSVPNPSVIHLIMGNEASDLDSMVSSVVYAFLLHQQKNTLSNKDAQEQKLNNHTISCWYVPVMNIPHDQFELRSEAPFSFGNVGIDSKLLPFLDDISFPFLEKNTTLSLTLVDHNRLSVSQEYLSKFVTGIIDHHVDEKLYSSQTTTRLIDTIGSCCTLVYELLVAANKEENNSYDIKPDVAQLLLSVILLDTSNMDPNLKKGTLRDQQAITKLAQIASVKDTDALFQHLKKLRVDISHLKTPQLLIKDAKFGMVNNISFAISSVPMSIEHWSSPAVDSDFWIQVQHFTAKKKLNLLVIMTIFSKQNTLYRHLFVYCPTINQKASPYLASLKEAFDSNHCDLQLEPIKIVDNWIGASESVLFYQQKNLNSSRKQVMPLLNLILAKL